MWHMVFKIPRPEALVGQYKKYHLFDRPQAPLMQRIHITKNFRDVPILGMFRFLVLPMMDV